MSPESWDCQAYRPDGKTVGALCFFAEPGERSCLSSAECAEKMTAERQRLFTHIHKLAATGDEVGQYLAGEFTSPEQLLGGEADN